jgi:hypothetical protein
MNNAQAQHALTVKLATPSELDVVLGLLQERIEWLRSRGSDQWSTWEQWRAKIRPSLERGQVWLLIRSNEAIGTITVEFRGDADFWTSEEAAVPAAYLSKLAIRLDNAGGELGALLTTWASDYAYRRGCRYVRLDAWKTNDGLHSYYVARGWTYLRTVANRARHSGALFQMPAVPAPAGVLRLVGEPAPEIFNTRVGGPAFVDPDEHGNWQPQHVHCGGMKVRYSAVGGSPRDACFIDFMRYRIRRLGEQWLFESVDRNFTNWQAEGVASDIDSSFQAERTYVLTHQSETEHDPCQMVVAVVPSEIDGTVRHADPRTNRAGQ